MVYFEQNDLRSMAHRLEWVLKDVQPWTLPNSVAAEDRQQAILQAVERGHRVVIVPYRRVNEGLNLQSGIDTILWVEMALNLFMLDQASRRAWRLGKREEVRIYYLAYANTAGHTKLRKLGQQSGAAAAFAGEPARGALIEHAGADKTTLARLSSLLEQSEGEDDGEEDAPVALSDEHEVAEEETALKAVFARRAEELRKALVRGREWLGGMQDDLAQRLAALAASPTATVSVWAMRPEALVSPILRARKAIQVDAERQQHDDDQREPVSTLPAPMLSAAALSPVLPDGIAASLPAVGPLSEPAPSPVVGSRAGVVFGRDEHIALARVRSRARRTRGYGEPLRRRMPVTERDIPSLGEGEAAGKEEQCRQVTMFSLWDLLVAPTSEAVVATPMRFALSSDQQHAPRQSHLWE